VKAWVLDYIKATGSAQQVREPAYKHHNQKVKKASTVIAAPSAPLVIKTELCFPTYPPQQHQPVPLAVLGNNCRVLVLRRRCLVLRRRLERIRRFILRRRVLDGDARALRLHPASVALPHAEENRDRADDQG
jgi:hypothetical protein